MGNITTWFRFLLLLRKWRDFSIRDASFGMTAVLWGGRRKQRRRSKSRRCFRLFLPSAHRHSDERRNLKRLMRKYSEEMYMKFFNYTQTD